MGNGFSIYDTQEIENQTISFDIDKIGNYAFTPHSTVFGNSTYLYYLGNECESLTGGWSLVNKNSSYKGILEKYDTYMKMYGGTPSSMCDAGACTVNYITNPNSSYLFVNIIDALATAGQGGKCGALTLSRQRQHDTQYSGCNVEVKKSGMFTMYNRNYSGYFYFPSMPNRSYMSVNCVVVAVDEALTTKVKQYGTTYSEVITNSVNLFNDTEALTEMVNNLNGRFMWTALSSSTFLNAFDNSSNKTILKNNVYWNKALVVVGR